jgi:hypothetical protein
MFAPGTSDCGEGRRSSDDAAWTRIVRTSLDGLVTVAVMVVVVMMVMVAGVHRPCVFRRVGDRLHVSDG